MAFDDLPDLPLDQPLEPPRRRFVRHPTVAPAPRWVAPLYLTLSVLLVPWIVYLAFARPAEFGDGHYRAAWVGLDAMEAIALALTAWLAYRRSTWVDMAATATATLLIVDAWFDLMTATPGLAADAVDRRCRRARDPARAALAVDRPARPGGQRDGHPLADRAKQHAGRPAARRGRAGLRRRRGHATPLESRSVRRSRRESA